MSSTKIVQTPDGPVLFSRVLAHSLEKGDLIAPEHMDTGIPRRVLARPERTDGGSLLLHLDDGVSKPLEVGHNRPVWRAVGARAGGIL